MLLWPSTLRSERPNEPTSIVVQLDKRSLRKVRALHFRPGSTPTWKAGTGFYAAGPHVSHRQMAHNPLRSQTPWPRYVPPAPWGPPVRLPRKPTRTPRHQRTPWKPIWRTAPAYVQSVSGTSTASGTVVASSITPTPGNCLAGFVNCANGQTVSGVADAGGTNAYTVGTPTTNASGARITPFYANNCPATAVVITATFSASAAQAVIEVLEYSGTGNIAQNRSLIDASGGGQGNTNAPTASVTPVQSGSLYLTAVGDQVGGITYTASGSVTRRISVTAPVGLAAGEQIGSSTSIASLASAWSASGTVQWTESVIVLRPGGQQALASPNAANFTSVSTQTTALVAAKLGEMVLGYVQTTTTGVTTTNFQDNQGNTWTLIGQATNPSGGSIAVYWTFATTTATISVTITQSGTSSGSFGLYPLPGILPSASPIDVSATNFGNGTALTVTTAATTLAKEAAFLFSSNPSSGTFTPLVGTDAYFAPSGARGFFSRILSSTGAVTMAATLGTSQQWAALAFTIKTGGVSFVQSVSGQGAASTSRNVTMAFNTAPGNNLVAAYNLNSGSGSVSSISAPDTWSRAEQAQNASGGTLEIWRAKNSAGGKYALNATLSGSIVSGVIAYEFSGGATDTWFDTGATNTGNSQTVSLTNSQPNYLRRIVIAAGGDSGTGRAETSASPFAQVQAALSTNTNLAAGIAMVFETGIPTGTSTTLAIPGGANVQWEGSIASFKIAASPTYQQLSGTVSESSTLTASGKVTHNAVSSVSLVGTVSGQPFITHRPSSSVSLAGTVTGQPFITHHPAGTISETSTLTANLFEFAGHPLAIQAGDQRTLSVAASDLRTLSIQAGDFER